MTPEQINRLMAEKVMDFTKHGHNSWLNANDGEIWFLDEFDPCHRIEHAMMALEKFEAWKLTKVTKMDDRKRYKCRIVDNDFNLFDSLEADTAPAAICLACIEAKKLEVRDEPILHHNSDH